MSDSGALHTEKQYYPLTHPQTGIWHMEKLYPSVSMGNICATMRILTDVDYHLLECAVNLVLEKNDALRLRVVEEMGQALQYVADYSYQKLEFFDFSADINELYRWDESQNTMPFPVTDAALCYFAMVKVGPTDGGVYMKMHHLVADAWSMILCANQIIEFYTNLKEGMPILPGDKPSFLAAIQTERCYQQSARFVKDRQFWLQKFADWQEATVLKNRKTGPIQTAARRKTLLLPQKLCNKIREHCEHNKVSEFSLFIAAVAMYINRVAGREDVTLGTTLLNRAGATEKETMGMFASIAVPLRLHITDDMNLNGFLRSISQEIMKILRHQKYPYDLLLSDVRERLGTTDSLFDVVVSYQNSKLVKRDAMDELVTRWHFNGHQIESLIINLNDRDQSGRLIIDYDYLSDMFYATEIEFIHQHIISLLWHALDNPVKPIAKLEMISEAEKKKILHTFNQTQAEFPSHKTIHQIFEEQAARTPDEPALYCGEETLTYRQLNEKANRLAHTLRQKGLGPEGVAGLMVYRSAEMVIGILGILKAGGGYLPIDPLCPPERAAFMLSDCNAAVLLVHNPTKDLPQAPVKILNLDEEVCYSGSRADPAPAATPDNLAYIIYTSGSTGNPKGVMLEHCGLVNRIHWMQKAYPLDADSVILQKTPYTFDVSVWEFTWWFFAGAKVCMLQPGGEKDPAVMIEAIRRYRVTTMHFVPSMLGIFLEFLEKCDELDALMSLKQVFASGEALNLPQVGTFNRLLYERHGTELYNLYGPTEATIDVSCFNCSPSVTLKTVPIGKPIDNIRLYILDKHLTLLPIGIPGELCIGGIGLARGYRNRPELTEAAFVPNPYAPGELLYRTGDLARWYAQGDIEYLGRLDHQLKIRGFRIELGEIENRLMKHAGVREAIAVGLDEDGRKVLCAYYTGTEIPAVKLKRFLGRTLPEYMVPSYYVHLKALPLSSNGKIDRKALPAPQSLVIGEVEYASPRNETDQKLAEIYAKVLKRPLVGIDDSLFDMGGDSLSVIQIYGSIYQCGWKISIADFYHYPTIRELSDSITGTASPGGAGTLEEIEVPGWHCGDVPVDIEQAPCTGLFLTGGTGFLGMHILAELMDTGDMTVYCLVRGASHQDARDRFLTLLHFYFGTTYDALMGTRIHIVNGDIAKERFGLSGEAYEALGQAVDTVIHSAAVTRFLGSYEQIGRINVGGTREAAGFALAHRCRFFHISTISVTGDYLVHNTGGGSYTENNFYAGQNYMGNPYVRSKFEAENLVFQLARQEGLEAAVCRMGNLTGRLNDGVFQTNIGDNGFYSALRSVLSTGTVAQGLMEEEIEFSPVDLAARAVVRIVSARSSVHHIFHVFNPRHVPMQELVEMLRAAGTELQLGGTQGVDAPVLFNASAQNPGIEIYLNESGETAFLPVFQVSAQWTTAYLRALGFEWPTTDEAYIAVLLEYLKRVGYLT
jgi:amino acid adenylation domain-containing protein/thioester reductase-like protein